MSNKSSDVKNVHERTSLGGEALGPHRRIGMMLAGPGRHAAVIQIVSEGKGKRTGTKSRRAVRLKISTETNSKEA